MEAHAEAWHLAREALDRQKQEHVIEVQTVKDAWQQALQEVARLSKVAVNYDPPRLSDPKALQEVAGLSKLRNNSIPGAKFQPITSPPPSSAAPAQSPAGGGAWDGEGGGDGRAGAGAGGEKGGEGGEEGEGEGGRAEGCLACSGNTFSKVLNTVT